MFPSFASYTDSFGDLKRDLFTHALQRAADSMAIRETRASVPKQCQKTLGNTKDLTAADPWP
jgi:hypothetical protein